MYDLRRHTIFLIVHKMVTLVMIDTGAVGVLVIGAVVVVAEVVEAQVVVTMTRNFRIVDGKDAMSCL